MKRKELTKIFMMISNWTKNTLVSWFYIKNICSALTGNCRVGLYQHPGFISGGSTGGIVERINHYSAEIKLFYINDRDQKGFFNLRIIINVLVSFFLLHLNTYVMGLRHYKYISFINIIINLSVRRSTLDVRSRVAYPPPHRHTINKINCLYLSNVGILFYSKMYSRGVSSHCFTKIKKSLFDD